MTTTFNKRLLIVWVILTSLTLIYVVIDHSATTAERYEPAPW